MKKPIKLAFIAMLLMCVSVACHAQTVTSKWDYKNACYTNDSYGIRWQLPTSIKWNPNNELPPGVPCVLQIHDKRAKITCQMHVQNISGKDTWEVSPETYTQSLSKQLQLDVSLCSSEKTYVEGVKALFIKDEAKYLGKTVCYFYSIMFSHKGRTITGTVILVPSEDKKLTKSGKDIMSTYFDGITLY